MAGKFVVKKGPSGKFRFTLVATNGQVVLTSQAYETKASAMKGIASIQRLAGDAAVDDQSAPAKPAAAKPVAAKKAAPAKKAPAKKAAPARKAPAARKR